jgi:tRNA G18 (ribose-2'-O)-methylase SpoU
VTPATIVDPADPRVDDYRRLRDPELRNGRGLFVAESTEVIQCVLEAPRYRVRSLLLTPNAYDRLQPRLQARSADVLLASRDVLTAITGVQLHRGGLALVERGAAPPVETVLAADVDRFVLLDDVTNPDNVGSIFRTARAFGIGGVVLSPGCADPLYRKTVRVSLGASLLVPWATDPAWPDSVDQLRSRGVVVAALTAAPDAIDLDAFAAGGLPPRLAILLGNEGVGLSDRVRQLADVEITIRMTTGIDSINVAAAAAIALHRLTSR